MTTSLWRSKVFWTSVAGIVGTALLWYAGKLTTQEALGAIWAALQATWFRQTVATRLDRIHAAVVTEAGGTVGRRRDGSS